MLLSVETSNRYVYTSLPGLYNRTIGPVIIYYCTVKYVWHCVSVYAMFDGCVQILPACNSWFDYVWAYFKVMVDVLTEKVGGVSSLWSIFRCYVDIIIVA